ncbi:MAG: hypothetical protein K2X32_05740 [Phycisphaerales bacterium]|nr:hypothetical protein [Phycisphaerales bacterium]
MIIDTINAITLLVSLYALIGITVGAAFVARAVDRLDHSAIGAGLMFRLAIFPAAAALWPVTLRLMANANAGALRHHGTAGGRPDTGEHHRSTGGTR